MASTGPDGLSAWVEPHRRRLEPELRRLLDLPARLGVRVGATSSRDGWRLKVELETDGAPDLVLDLGPARADGRAFVRGPALSLSYRKLAGGADPFATAPWRDILSAVAGRVPEIDAAAVEALESAMAEAGGLAEVEDWMYRQGPRPGAPIPEGTLRLGFRCNQDCGFCWQGRDWPEPPEDVYLRWLEELAEAGVRLLTLTGGEPTLHEALPRLVERAAGRHRMRVRLETNAIRLRHRAYLARLVEAGLAELFVSLHSADPDISDRMTRAPGTFARTVEGIEAALDAGLSVTVNSVVDRQNHQGLAAHAAFVIDRFVRPFPSGKVDRVVYSHPCGYYDPALWAEALVPLDAVRPHLVAAVRQLTGEGVAVECVGTCGFPPCLFHEAPEVLRFLDLCAIDAPAKAGHVYGPECEGCSARPHCLGLREEYVRVLGLPALRPFDRLPGDFPDRP